MSCIIGSPNLKVFGKAIHALARISDDLYIEALSTGLVFRTVNSSRSAYVCFNFKPEFFISYREDSSKKCRVLLKSCLMAFHSLPTLEKTVEKCVLDLTEMDDYLIIQFLCKHGMTKLYNVPLIENETVQAALPQTGFKCKLTASSRLLHDGIQNFSSSVDEVTLTVCASKVIMKNYIEDEPDPNKVVHTEITLESDEFESYNVNEETELTFCMKELKAVLNFSEGCNVPVSIQCHRGGMPILFTVDGLRGVEASFVLATLADRITQSSTSSSQVSTGIQASTSGAQEICRRPQQKRRKKTHANISLPLENGSALVAPASPMQRMDIQMQEPGSNPRPEMVTLSPSPEEDMDEAIPLTPPYKKFRSAFLGLSQATFTSMAPDPDEVLAPDSEEED